MPSGLSQSHQEIAGQFQWELLQLICLGSGGQHVQRPPPRGMGRPIGLQCPCNSFTRQEVRGASDSTNQRIENNALVSSSGFTGGARRVVYLVVSYSPVRGSAKDTRLRIHLDRQAKMVQTADGSPEEGDECHCTACRHQPTVQGGGSAVGLVELTVGEDYLPLHEMSTNSKRTTCLPPDMACEVHHTKSGYEQLKSRNSPFRPTRS